MSLEQISDPRQTLDMKRACSAWLGSPMAAHIAEMQAEGYRSQGMTNDPGEEIESLRAAQNFWVAPDMVSVAATAQKTMPDEDVLLEEPPAPHGFLLLGQPFTLRCGDPKCAEDHPFTGLHWRPARRTLPANAHTDAQQDDGLLRAGSAWPSTSRNVPSSAPLSHRPEWQASSRRDGR